MQRCISATLKVCGGPGGALGRPQRNGWLIATRFLFRGTYRICAVEDRISGANTIRRNTIRPIALRHCARNIARRDAPIS